MTYLNAMDASFIHMESNRTPMHVGGLMVFKLPERASKDYLNQLFERLLCSPVSNPPFNYRLKAGAVTKVAPQWKVAKKIDIDYHVRHSALPYPGGEKELGILVARLHSNHMDMERPLWEFHLIEGLENNRFALYMKTHHSMIDGMGAMKLIKKWLTEEPDIDADLAPWSASFAVKKKARKAPKAKKKSTIIEALKHQANATIELGKKLLEMSDAEKNPEGGISAALHTPDTLFNQHISPQRRLATQLYDVERFKALQTATGATINDICLAIVGTATRRYLDELEVLPEDSLVVSIPVALPRSEGKHGNAAIGFAAPLLTDVLNPVDRLSGIKAITQRTKQQLRSLSIDALKQFSVLGITPLMVGQLTGMGIKMPAMFNLVVSNVVATRKKLYWQDAEMEAMYPISILFDGYALNITIVGYADKLALGFTGCRNALPSLQRLAVYTGEALAEMEQLVLGEDSDAADPVLVEEKKKDVVLS
ncbi:MAG: wax ester/triacylglycerol synthase family O-acyltransferase [Pseudomonadales bacterium]|nr:wax ester/triacylglycerol synthase family O-acyltransferase [Pseudomonadales bacterium]